ncbi:hypothetical protein I4I79_32925 [Pseudonocardia sp. KRD-176]|nr:hypothetical protein [Pseudonocardia oceani]
MPGSRRHLPAFHAVGTTSTGASGQPPHESGCYSTLDHLLSRVTPPYDRTGGVHHLFARFPDVKVHLYAKAERPARKVGHVTVLGDDMAAVRARAALAAHWLSTAEWADGWSIHGAEAEKETTNA